MNRRNISIQLAFRKEINLSTKAVKDKTKYTRKQKHKKATEYDKVINDNFVMFTALCS